MRNSIWWAGSWGFHYDFARNVVISGDNNTSLSRTDNQKNNFLVLGEGLNDGINDSVGSAEKTFSINFTKSNIKFSSSLHYNGNESYLHVSKKEICKFKPHDNMPWHEFCLGTVSKEFTKDELSEICLNGTVCDFSV